MALKICLDGNMYTVLNRNVVVKVWTTTLSISTLPKTLKGTAAYMNHLICWRSSPRTRCSLTTSENSAAKVLINSSVVPKNLIAAKTKKVVSPPPITPKTPNGFSIQGKLSKAPGHNASASAVNAAPKSTPPVTICHLLDGGRPSGNNNTRHTARVGSANHSHEENQARYSSPSNAGFSNNAESAYATVKGRNAESSPALQKSQPIGLAGRRETINAPTVG